MKKFILIVLVACSFTACPCDDDGPEFTADWLLKNMTDETIVVKSFWTYAHPEPEVVKPGDSYWLYNFYWEREDDGRIKTVKQITMEEVMAERIAHLN